MEKRFMKNRMTIGAALLLVVICVPAMVFAETDRLTVEDPATGAVKFKVTSDGNVSGNKLAVTTSADQYLLSATNNGYAGSGGMELITYLSNPGAGSAVYLRQSRGTLAAPIDVQAGDRLGAFFFAGWAAGGWRYPASFEANIGTGTVNSTSAPGYLVFKTTPDGTTARQERLRIDQDGNVGIGATAPTQKLEVNGGVRINTSTTRPTCNSANRGTFWFSNGGTGNDVAAVCARVAGILDWKPLW